MSSIRLSNNDISISTKEGDSVATKFADSSNIDAFGRLRISENVGVFDSQFTYDLQPLLFGQIVTGTGATIAHDSTNRHADLTEYQEPYYHKARVVYTVTAGQWLVNSKVMIKGFPI